MKVIPEPLQLKKKMLQKQLNELWREAVDPEYRQFRQDFVRLRTKFLRKPTSLQENIDPKELKDWTPARLILNLENSGVAWLDLGRTPFTDTTAIRTICRSWQKQNRPRPIWTNLDVLIALKDISPGLKPKGFFFNTWKCGSTLLSKMLCSLDRNLVISESQVIRDAAGLSGFMTGFDKLSESFRIELLQSTVSALGQPRLGVEENYVVRLDRPSMLDLPLIRKAFPETPIIFLYRHPVEVMVSMLTQSRNVIRGLRADHSLVRRRLNSSAIDLNRISPEKSHLLDKILDFSSSNLEIMSDEEFEARSLGLFFEIPTHYLDKKTLVVNYEQLLSASCLSKILDFYQIQVSVAEEETMLKQLKFYAKEDMRDQKYRDDRSEKQKIASNKILDAAEKWAMESYRNLESTKMPI